MVINVLKFILLNLSQRISKRRVWHSTNSVVI